MEVWTESGAMVDPMMSPWRAQANDVIGGWCITLAEQLDSRTPAEGAADLADFVSEEAAHHIATLHNDFLARVGSGSRPSWDAYFMEVAQAISMRADCSRRKVGAVIVRDHRIRATGYNGARSGGPSCLAGDCPRGNNPLVEPGSSYDTGSGACIALHAEQNACLYASRDDCEGATLYVTHKPCDGCVRMIQGSGIQTVVYLDAHGITTRKAVLEL